MTDLRMDAYYYFFEPTGVYEIDLILSAVACAGKAYHHTEAWQDETPKYHPDFDGECPQDWIQSTADKAAKMINDLRHKG